MNGTEPTIGNLKKLIKDLPDDTIIQREDWDGASLGSLKSLEELLIVKSSFLDGRRSPDTDMVLKVNKTAHEQRIEDNELSNNNE